METMNTQSAESEDLFRLAAEAANGVRSTGLIIRIESILSDLSLLDPVAIAAQFSHLHIGSYPELDEAIFAEIARLHENLRNKTPSGAWQIPEEAVNVLAWAIITIRDWQYTGSNLVDLIAAIFICDYAAGQSGWETAVRFLAPSRHVLDCFTAILQTSKSLRYSIPNEARAIESSISSIQIDEDEGNIDQLVIWHWRPVNDYTGISTFLEASIICSAHFQPAKLLAILQAATSFPFIAIVARRLSFDGLGVALQHCDKPVNNSTVLREILSKQRIQDLEQYDLAPALIETSKSSGLWKTWMSLFNKQPQQYPNLQRHLGSALAVASKEALQAYADSSDLHYRTSGGLESRAQVAICLTHFAQAAKPEVRKILWSLLFQRWSEWNFGVTKRNGALFQISCSDLDFGVVGYLFECLSDEQLDVEEGKIMSQLSSISNEWHRSITSGIAAWHATLSRFQLFHHVQELRKKGELGYDGWLPTKYYLPHFPDRSAYDEIRFRTTVSRENPNCRLR